MPTIKQLIRNTRQPIRNVTKSPALRGCPQRRGTCTRVYVRLVSIILWAGTKTRKQTFQYQWSVPANRIERKKEPHSPSKKLKKSIIPPVVYEFYGFHWCKSNHDEKQFPFGSKWLSIKRRKSYLKSIKIGLLLWQERT